MSPGFSEDRAALERLLAGLEPEYDPDVHLYGHTSGNPWWMSHVPAGRRVHGMLENLNLALALLSSGEARYVSRASGMLIAVCARQDADPVSVSYGGLGRYFEEHISETPQPERLGVDFEGVALAHILIEHADKLSPDALCRAREAMRHAGWGTFRRNTGLAYSNIAIMGACVKIGRAHV